MRIQEKKVNKILQIVKEHIYKNLKQYLITSALFFLGIIIGVAFINYTEIETIEQIGNYIQTFINSLKENYQIDSINLLKDVVANHILCTILLWFMGCTIIGIPIVYGIIVYRGFSLGYTISTVIYTLGIGKGTLFCFVSLFFQNIIIIPAILALSVSCSKLYKVMVKDKRKENIKLEIIRHSMFSFFILFLLIISALIEVYISNNMLSLMISFF